MLNYYSVILHCFSLSQLINLFKGVCTFVLLCSFHKRINLYGHRTFWSLVRQSGTRYLTNSEIRQTCGSGSFSDNFFQSLLTWYDQPAR